MTVNKTTEKLPKSYGNKQWQKDFQEIKEATSEQFLFSAPDNDDLYLDQYTFFTYINDVLENIRCGGTDYCFYVYQIAELLKYEKDKLRTFYDKKNECFIVWLYK